MDSQLVTGRFPVNLAYVADAPLFVPTVSIGCLRSPAML